MQERHRKQRNNVRTKENERKLIILPTSILCFGACNAVTEPYSLEFMWELLEVDHLKWLNIPHADPKLCLIFFSDIATLCWELA